MTPRTAVLHTGMAALALATGWTARRSPPAEPAAAVGYAVRADTLRERPAEPEGAPDGRVVLGERVPGYLSPRGLPPVEGTLTVTDTGLMFRSADGRLATTLPVVGPARASPRGYRRATGVSLAYIDDSPSGRAYFFRVEGDVFETDAPATLLQLAAHPGWLDSVRPRERAADRALVRDADSAGVRALLAAATGGAYADTLYAVFGRPSRPAGIVGTRGRTAGRLGEYVASRDSLALDPARMSSVGQLRHTLAHELAHRWQARSAAQLAALWRGVPAIRDPRRYGYTSLGEHQAEAAAFAMHFLLATAGGGVTQETFAVLEHYESLVPGTRVLARYFVMQPAFRGHPFRVLLTTARAS